MGTEFFKPMRVAIAISLLTLIYGFVMGAVFGALEDQLKEDLFQRGHAQIEAVYNGDAAQLDAVVKKSWVYYKRSHMHANGIGVVSLVLALVLALFIEYSKWSIRVASLFSIGGFGYGLFWLLAGYHAPVAGSPDAAKAAFAWLAIPATTMMLFGLIATIVYVLKYWFLAKRA
jgi:hypothetical protein